MNRRVASGLLVIALAGCAQARPVLPERERPLPPANVGTLPSLFQTINGGLKRPVTGRAPGVPGGENPNTPPQVASAPPSVTTPADAATPTAEKPAIATRVPAGPLPGDPPAVATEPPASAEVPDIAPPDIAPPTDAVVPASNPEDAQAPPAEPEPSEPPPEPISSEPPPVDPAVRTVSHEEPKSDNLSIFDPNPGEPATLIAAKVGDTVITLHELKMALRQQLKDGTGFDQLSRQQKNQRAREALEYLIDRAVVVEAARRELKKPKQWEMFQEYINKAWLEKGLPPLLRRYQVKNEFELKTAMADRGESLEDAKDFFKADTITREYFGLKMMSKLSPPGLPELWTYYRQNLHRFDRPAQMTWREIFLAVDAKNDRDTVRGKAEAVLERLGRGEDFAKVAREVSQGPKASDGGLWQTSPGSFRVAAVNQALANLAPRQMSPLLEVPEGFYIVRLEEVRPPGPAPFEEVQRQIADALFQAKYEREMEVFLSDLRRRTSISSPLFEGTESEPKQVRDAIASD